MLSLIFILLLLLAGVMAGINIVKFSFRRSLSTAQRLKVVAGCVVFGAAPLLLSWLGLSLSKQFDCEVYAIIFQCSKAPFLSDLVTYMVFVHWLAIITLPFALMNIAVVIFSLLARRFR